MTDQPFLSRIQTWQRARDREVAAAVRRLPLRARADLPFFMMVALLVVVLGLVAYAGMVVVRRLGWLDPVVVAPVADERILDNLRRDLPAKTLITAAWHPGLETLTVSQTGGALHHLNKATGLWSRERPVEQLPSLGSDIVQLRAGCGGDAVSAAACADPASLWALSEKGALARRLNSHWQALIGDSRFMGSDGRPVEAGAATTASLSTDGQWLFMGTKAQGGGLYDLKQRYWLPLGGAAPSMPSGQINVAVWWKDRFAIGGEKGLTFLDPDGGQPRAVRSPILAATVSDLLVLEDGRLLVLEKHPCQIGGEGCLRVQTLDGPAAKPVILMDERNRYADLDMASLFFADIQGRSLLVAGRKGVFVYDMARHNWTRLDDRPVLAARREQGSVFYAYTGGVAQVTRRAVKQNWGLPGKQVVQLVGADRQMMALTDDGELYALPPDGNPQTLFQPGGTAGDPQLFNAAYAAGDRILLTGPRQALLHDVRRRLYTDINVQLLPDWLTDGRTRTLVSGERIFGLVSAGGQVTAQAVDLSALGGNQASMSSGTSPAVASPIRQARAWAGGGIAVIDGTGSLRHLDVDRDKPLTGAAIPALDRLSLRDVATVEDVTAFATGTGIIGYDHVQRRWVGPMGTGIDQGNVNSLAGRGNRLLFTTDQGRLGEVKPGASDGTALIGAQRIQLKAAAPSDVLVYGPRLFLAGRSSVDMYDLSLRTVIYRWSFPGDAPVEIVDQMGWSPLTLSDGRLHLDGGAIAPDGGRVLSATLGSNILTVREKDGARHLRLHSKTSPQKPEADQCLFRNPSAGGRAQHLLDARMIGDGWLMALTDDGLRLYNEMARSWYPVRPLSRAITAIHVVDDHLVLVAGNGAGHVQLVPLDKISRPQSCSTQAVALPEDWREFRSVAIDETAGRLVWIAADGAVIEWAKGQQTQLLAATAGMPATDSLLRVFNLGDRLAFAVPEGLLLYQLADHAWSRVEMRSEAGPLRGLRDLNLEPDGDGQAVTARLPDGRTYLGNWNGADKTATLAELRLPSVAPFGQSADGMLDAMSYGGRWVFLMGDRIKRFDPATGRFAPDILLPQSDASRTLVLRGRRLVVEEDGGKRWWVARATLPDDGASPIPVQNLFDAVVPVAGQPTMLADDGRVVRLLPDGSVQACQSDGTCRLTTKPAMPLDPATVTAAFENGPLVLFQTARGWRLHDVDTRSERQAPGALGALGPVVETRRQGTVLWLRDAAGQVVALDAAGTLVAQATGVAGLGVDGNGNIWLRGANQMFEKGALKDAATFFKLPKTVGIQALTVANGSSAAMLGSDRRLRTQVHGEIWLEPPLASDIDLTKVQELFRITRTDQWWLRAGPMLTRLVAGNCPGTKPDACLRSDLSLALPGNSPILSIDDQLPISLTIRLADGRILETRMGASGLEPLTTTNALPVASASVNDVWPSWRNRIGPRLDGVPAINPILGLQADGSTMQGRTAGGMVPLGITIPPQPQPLPALDAGWLKWERASRHFQLVGMTGLASLTPEQLVRDGRFIFAGPGMAVADTGGMTRLASRYGILSFQGRSLSLTDPQNRFQPQDMPAPVAAAHGRFLFDRGGVPLTGGAMVADDGRHLISQGDATWTEQLRQARVETSLRVAGQPQGADGAAGFGWDRRAGVALADGKVQVQTSLGILPADGLAGADPGWSGRLPSAGRLFGRDGGDLFMADGASWYRRMAGRWQPATAADLLTRELASSPRWRWRATPQGVMVQGPSLVTTGQGLAFNDDLIRAAGWIDSNSLVVVDGAGLTVGTMEAVRTGQAAHKPIDPAIDTIWSMRPKPGVRMLLARGNGGTFGWDAAAQGFVPLADGANPQLNRQLIDHPRLRMAVIAGRVVTELRLDDLSGGSVWQPITLENGFPFDRVNTVHIRGNDLFLGTDAGLEVHTLYQNDLGFDTISRLLDMRAGGSGPLSPVLRMGEPVDSADLLAARSAGRCVQFDGTTYKNCVAADMADITVRARAPWWHWQRDAAGRVTGDYVASGGKAPVLPAMISGGRLPHDRIRDMVICQGRAATLWEDGPVMHHPGVGLELRTGLRLTVPGMSRDARLFCLERPLREAGLDIPGGLYWITDDAVMHDDGSAWQPIAGEAEKAALRQSADQSVPYAGARLRLVQEQRGGLRFQHLGNNDRWADLAWKGKRLALDTVDRMTLVKGQPWAATAAGFVPFQQLSDGSLGLDPDQLVILPSPANDCRVSDLETGADGESWVRCNANTAQVYHGTLNPAATRPAFQPADKDPFADPVLVAATGDNHWQWQLTGHVDGKPGQLAATYRDDPVSLSSGRLSLDMIAQIRAFTPQGLEVLTEGAGWYRSAGKGLNDLQRPANDRIDHRAVRRIAVARGADNDRRLCLEFAERRTLALNAALQAVDGGAGCRDDLGTDGLWQYEQDADGLTMQAVDRRQRIGSRTLKEGRFTDEVATGLPVPRRDKAGAVEYLVPTLAGVIAFDAAAEPAGLYLPAFADLPPTAAPSVLVADREGRVSYLGRSALVGLEDEVPTPLPLPQLLPDDLEAQALEPGPGSTLRLGWKQGDRAGWTLFDPQAPNGALTLAEPVDISGWREYTELRTLHGNANPNLLIGLERNHLALSSGFSAQPVRQDLDFVGSVRGVVRAGRTLMVIGSQDIMEIDMVAALRVTVSPQTPPP
ncbi:hypothetical protein GE253_12620 [Niveispirillum sp. SYP-B3756]|uniref:hypothetical protein n=1 Tax=Niveispirillum sp. SYP-B3756 TaxID=2662178 RepID=UPI0012927EBF|nr:hypothetical protein [Niveispirillum sp. SYP-B3756]MQP66185.1 hypothetical protein [Niveispirillum sp. SYP-B3756]